MVIGYFLTKWYLKQSMAIALTGISENIFQPRIQPPMSVTQPQHCYKF